MGSHRIPRQSPQLLRRSLPDRHAQRLAHNGSGLFAGVARKLTRPWSRAPRLINRLRAEQNNFSFLRLIMALAVLISHVAFLASGSFQAEPLVASTGYSLGQYGVQGFFILSGILVAQSLASRRDLIDYGRARVMRIFPALIVCVMATALALGPALSLMGRDHYFQSFGVVQYIAKTLSLSTGSAQLPGLFVLNPASGLVNQSLWTLKYEVACYLLLGGLAALICRLPSPRIVTPIFVGVWAAIMFAVRPSLLGAETGFFGVLAYFALFFGTGVIIFLARRRLRLAWQPVAVFACAFYLSIGSDFAEISSALFIGYALLWVSTLSIGSLRAYANANDYSYGVYIYGYPVTQAILSYWPNINVFSLFTMTLGITMLLAFVSWELVERPALVLVHRWRMLRHAASSAAVTEHPWVVDGIDQTALATSVPLLTEATNSDTVFVPARRTATVPGKLVAIDKSRLRARMAKIAASQGDTARA